jgi:hypothetical protein
LQGFRIHVLADVHRVDGMWVSELAGLPGQPLPNERVGDLLPKITCTWLRSEQPLPLRFGGVQR